jgi:hypothetical protein
LYFKIKQHEIQYMTVKEIKDVVMLAKCSVFF